MRKMMTGIVLSGLLVSASGCYRVNVATRAPKGGGEAAVAAPAVVSGPPGLSMVTE